jgi:prepilin-type processing-associated H-X9-DG protein
MLQYRLATLFLIVFFVAATAALFGVAAFWIGAVLLLVAICLNRAKYLTNGIILSFWLTFGGLICPGFLWLASYAHIAAQRAQCRSNLTQIGLALRNHHDSRRNFPPVYTCDNAGKPLFSWIVPLLPYMEYDSLFFSLKLDEPWNGPHNAKSLNQFQYPELCCPSVKPARENRYAAPNYIAIIGPGTIWRSEGTVKLSDLPDGGSTTVALVEVADSGKHWAEPFALTADEVLENMRTGKGVRISSCHQAGVNILFADGKVRCLPSKMPLSLWRKILAGEVPVEDLDDLKSRIDPHAPDMVDVYVGTPEPGEWTILLGTIVWLVSVVLLFRRAVKSRKKPESEPVVPAAPVDSAGGMSQ